MGLLDRQPSRQEMEIAAQWVAQSPIPEREKALLDTPDKVRHTLQRRMGEKQLTVTDVSRLAHVSERQVQNVLDTGLAPVDALMPVLEAAGIVAVTIPSQALTMQAEE